MTIHAFIFTVHLTMLSVLDYTSILLNDTRLENNESRILCNQKVVVQFDVLRGHLSGGTEVKNYYHVLTD
jgi:hypothetical protein